MDKDYINKLQRFTIDYYRLRCRKSLWIASEFCCSEMARYLGYKVLDDLPGVSAYIIKGVLGDTLAHDVLLVEENGECFILDPTVWQIFKNKRSILMGKPKSLDDSVQLAKKIYKGDWSISEKLKKAKSKSETKKLINIIDEIISENCR